MPLITAFDECVGGGGDLRCPSDLPLTVIGIVVIVLFIGALAAWLWFQRKVRR